MVLNSKTQPEPSTPGGKTEFSVDQHNNFAGAVYYQSNAPGNVSSSFVSQNVSQNVPNGGAATNSEDYGSATPEQKIERSPHWSRTQGRTFNHNNSALNKVETEQS